MQLKFSRQIVASLALCILGSYVYLGFEWLFFVTKPSLLSFLSTFEQVSVLLVAPLPLAFVTMTLCCLVCLPFYFLIQRVSSRAALLALLFVPIVLLGATQFILIENFTYTMFAIGVSTFTGYGRIFHVVVFLYLLFVNYRLLSGWLENENWMNRHSKWLASLSLAMLLVSLLTILLFSDKQARGVPLITQQELDDVNAKGLPNILIFSTDGLNNDSMSAFGYERPTTPFIDSLLDESLVFENHYTNSAKTTGSVGSLLSAKHPTNTRVIYRPDVFTGVHSFQHLPGLLRQVGYTSGDESVRHYVDAHDLNMRESFHYANDRDLDNEGLPLPQIIRGGFSSSALFIESVYARISSRFLHVLGVRRMYNPFLAVTQPDAKAWQISDRDRVDRIKEFIKRTESPFFAHVHLLNTHGDFFPAENTQFTGTREQADPWEIDFYDNAVLGYDNFTKEIVGFLKDQGKFDNTIIVLNSDHGYKWAVTRPIPLIIRFPNASRVGVVTANSQRLDIAPTIIDYLGLSVPQWMDGSSLLDLKRSIQEPIYIVNRQASADSNGWRVVEDPQPPFYTMGKLYSVYCNWVFILDLNGKELRAYQSRGHTAECPRDQFPSDEVIRTRMVAYLQNRGYDTSGL